MRPLLQVALDHCRLPDALRVAAQVGDDVDILEAGTILCASEGMRAVAELRRIAGPRIVLADLRIVRAGRALARLAFDAGAHVVVVMSNAPTATLHGARDEAELQAGQIQLELVEGWTPEQALSWIGMGITQVAQHRAVEASDVFDEGWTSLELDQADRLAQVGLKVTLTGGMRPEHVERLAGRPVAVVVAGKAITAAPDPRAAACEFRKAIEAAFP